MVWPQRSRIGTNELMPKISGEQRGEQPLSFAKIFGKVRESYPFRVQFSTPQPENPSLRSEHQPSSHQTKANRTHTEYPSESLTRRTASSFFFLKIHREYAPLIFVRLRKQSEIQHRVDGLTSSPIQPKKRLVGKR